MMYAIVNKTTGKVNSISSFKPENIKADEVIIDNFDVADINLFRFYIYILILKFLVILMMVSLMI